MGAMVAAWESIRDLVMKASRLPKDVLAFPCLNKWDRIILPMKRSKGLRWLGLAVQCGMGMLLLWWIIIGSNVDGGQLVQRLTQASFLSLTLGILCFIAAMGLGALRYYLFLPSSTSIVYLMGTTLFQNALLTFVPWRMGEISYPLLLRRDYDIPLASSGAVILAIRLTDLLVVVVVALGWGARFGLNIGWKGALFGATVLLVLLVVFAFAMWRNDAPAPLRMLVAVLGPLREPHRLASFVLLSVAVFALTTIQSTFIFRAMALTVTLPDMALLNALTLLAAVLPIHPPGGWGTMDSIQAVILERLSYSPRTSLISSILAVHAFYTFLILVGGIVGWLLLERIRPILKAAPDHGG